MEDTLKTVAVGIGGSMASWMEILPPMFSALGALATLVYMLIKIHKELK
tara:strand:- start:127 stop:273 length:147 start_codon:yes stop_codon:yes gene_type:complete